MSRPTRRSANHWVTIWPITGTDPWEGVTYGAPYKVFATFEQGSSKQYNDAQGVKYIPKSIYWYELESNGKPSTEWPIALGDHTLESDPNNVKQIEYIRNSVLQDCGRQQNDLLVLT